MRAESLFHFTKSMDLLKSILSEKAFWSCYCLEDVSWIRSRKQHWALAMVCFCDIPLSKISNHTNCYGSYGIGLSKSWGKSNGLNPVLYLNDRSPLKRCLQELFKHADWSYEGVGPEAYVKAIELAAYVKPYEGIALRDGVETNKKFYDESEWRYVPHNLYKTTYHFDDDKRNNSRVHALNFSEADIEYIFVPSRRDVTELIAHLRVAFADLCPDVMASLFTRIITLEELGDDI